MGSLDFKFIVLPLLVIIFPFQAEEGKESLLDKMLGERIEMTKELNAEMIEEVQEMEQKDKLLPIEERLGELYLEHLEYVRSLKDEKLKRQILEYEILNEVSTGYYDLEYAVSFLEKGAARLKIKKATEKLEQLKRGEVVASEESKTAGSETKTDSP